MSAFGPVLRKKRRGASSLIVVVILNVLVKPLCPCGEIVMVVLDGRARAVATPGSRAMLVCDEGGELAWMEKMWG